MDRSPKRLFARTPRTTAPRWGFLTCALALGACGQLAAPGEGAGGDQGTGEQPGSAGTGDGTGGAGGAVEQAQPLPDPTGKIDPRLLADATVNQPREVVVMMDQQTISTAAIDQALASATDPNQIAVLTARLDAVKDQMMDRLRAQPIVTLNRLQTLPAMHVRVDSTDALMALAADATVGRVVMNDEHELMDSAPDLTLINQPQAAAAGKLGSGATVAVLDTGTDFKRAPFNCTAAGASGCPIVYAQDFAPSDNSVDDNGHGTNVSGIVLSVAPAAHIVALDVFSGASAWTSDIMTAIDWVIQNKAKYNIVAINMSLGGGTSSTTCPSDPLAVSISSARAAGILSAVASGNSGSLSAISSPACGPDAVSVGAVHATNLGGISWSNCSDATTAADKVACFSCSSSFLTILAPGVNITAAGITMSGTSQATPHVAGAIAVLAAAFPNESATDRVTRLTKYGVPVRDARNGITKPRLDLLASLNGAASTTPTPPTTPTTPAVGPTGTITLNAKASYTKAVAVTATLAVTSGTATQVCLSEATTCTAYAAAASSKSFTLSKGDGAKTVRAWWKDAKGNVSATPASATITLDTTAPTNGTVSASAKELTATFTWSGFADAGSGLAGYRLVTGTSATAASCTGTAAYEGTATTFTKAMTAGTIYARVCGKDAIGNIGAGATTTIVLKAGTHPVSLASPSSTSLVGNSAGGTLATDTCPAGQALIGFAGSLSAATTTGTHRQVKGVCGTVSITGTAVTVGVGTTMTTRGPAGTAAWTRSCPANQVVVGFSGRTGLLVDQLTFTCAPLTAAASTAGSALNVGAAKALAAIGGTGGTAFGTKTCGSGQIANSMTVRTGDNMDAFALACSRATVGN